MSGTRVPPLCGRGAVLVWLAGWAALLAPPLNAQTTYPPNFQETTIFSGLTLPTVVKFASDGRVFVAEKSGLIKVFASLSATTPTIFADLRTNVHNFWDRGLLGLELDPNFPASPYVYVLYSLDKNPGDPSATIPTWGTAGADSDGCPDPPGATSSSGGCAVLARLSRLTASGNVMTGPEEVFLEGWCQQYPSHSIGALAFGADGKLYVSGGDGSNFFVVDYGQHGGSSGAGTGQSVPVNVCGDPPGGLGGAMTPPTAEGGGLRSQSLRRAASEPVLLNGAILRLDPATGGPASDNPLIGSSDPIAQRIVAYGLRNPFRFALRPGTNEVWTGDVGWDTWEEIDRIPDVTATPPNLGWPCYEGVGQQGIYDGANLSLCESLYSGGGALAPFYTYKHSDKIAADEFCFTGSSSISGLAFYDGGAYPASYQGALFFADYSRRCIWAMLPDGTGTPDPATIINFASGMSQGAVDLEIGPGGDLFYVDFDRGLIVRVEYFSSNQPPTAVIQADQTSGAAPLTVQFDGTGSSDPDPGETALLTYSWDLNGDNVFGDSTLATPSPYTYTPVGDTTVRLRVKDPQGATNTAAVVISSGNTPPTGTISTPLASTTWVVGDTISFSGSASDAQQGTLPASALTWTLYLQHCPSNCHQHTVQTFSGVASGSFPAPDHDYPSHLELRLIATDAGGLTDTKSVDLQPKTVDLSFDSVPSGLTLGVNSETGATPFTRTVIVGSGVTMSASSPQTLASVPYSFFSWSDGGAQTHGVTAPATPAAFTATYLPPQPAVSIGDATVTEGDAGLVSASFVVTLSFASIQTVAVSYSTADGTAVSGSDYAGVSGQLSFAAGVTSRTLTVSVTGDNVRENDETFTVDLSAPVNASLADAQGLGTILDDDPLPALTIGDASAVEGGSGETNAVFAVTLSGPSASTVSVEYATSDGTALAGSDYAATTGVLSFAPGATTATVAVAVTGDTRRERHEAFLVDLSAASGASIARARGQGVILDDDSPTGACRPILTVPIVLDTPGTYCLAASLATPAASGAAIAIAADGITLDLAGHTLSNSAGPATQTYGVYANGQRNLAVRNGSLQGFFTGVLLAQPGPFTLPQGLVVSGLQVSASHSVGIRVEGRANQVLRNQVLGTGGTTLYGADADARGIEAVGPDLRLAGNLVHATRGQGTGTGYGIAITSGNAAQVVRNRVSNTAPTQATGILVTGSTGVAVGGNRLTSLGTGIVFAGGTTGTHAGNTFIGVATPYVGP